MSKPSFEKFDYTLRPAKNVERKMMCEAYARLGAVAPVTTYRYVGLGAVAFRDFIMVHQRLGITRMTNIEIQESIKPRFFFNRPYSCITMKWGDSWDVLPTLAWRERCIVWLDYDKPLDVRKLADIRTVVSRVRSGSLLVVTVDAEDRVEPGPEAPIERMTRLHELVGEERVPHGTRRADLGEWGLAKVFREVINNEIVGTVGDRNRPRSPRWRFEYHQLFNFHYADGAKMLTVGGVLLQPGDRARMPLNHFDDLEFISHGEEPYLIEVPVLTWREARHLDKLLPRSAPQPSRPTWLDEKERERYAKVYRHFPTYLEAEL